MTADFRRYLTRKQLAEYLNVSERTADRWYRDGAGPPAIRLGAKRIVYDVNEVDAWAASRSFRHRAAELAHAA